MALASTVWAMWHVRPVWRQRVALLEAQQIAQAALDSVPPPAASDNAEAPGQVAAAQAMQRLRAPWTQLLAGIESAGDAQVVLLGLEPDALTREIRIQAQARDMAALLAYVRRLADIPGMSNVTLQTHQIQVQHPQRPVDGSIAARWRVEQ